MPKRSFHLAALQASLAFVAVNCSHAQVKLSAMPNQVCPGTPVKLAWSASATPRLTNDKAISGLDHLEKSGMRTVVINETTTFTLEAGWWMTKNGTQASVTVVPIGAPTLIGGPTTDPKCTDDGWVSITTTVPPVFWADGLRVGRITSPDNRVFRVSHAGIVAQTTPTDAFVNTSVSGEWTIETPLLPGQGCEASQPLPNTLGVDVQPICARLEPVP